MSVDEGLPAGWALAPLADLLTAIETGKSFKCDERPPKAGEIGVVKVSAVSWGEYQERESKTCLDETRVNEALFVHSGDFLFSRANTIELVGACVIARQVTLRVMLSDKILRFKFISEGMKPWILNLLRSRQGRLQIEALASGNQDSMRNIGQERIGQILVPLPPVNEQTRIVEKLEELLSDLDAGVAELKAAQRKLAQYRQSLLKAAVEGALTADWRAARAQTGEPQETGAELLQRILTERRTRWEASQLARFAEQGKTPPKGWQAKYKEPGAPDATDLPALPDNWAWATIDQIAEVGTGVTPLRSKKQYFEGGTIPWVTSGALNAEVVTASNELITPLALRECRLVIYPSGSVLVAMYGEGKTRGKCAELKLPATINQAIAALVLDGEAAPVRDHLKTFLLDAYEAMRKQASGGVQPNLNLQIIKSLQLPLPPLDEQAEMQRQLSDQLAAHDAHQIAIDRGLKQSEAQRKNILKAAFAGQLVPQDPNDEPASVLLERIRAEREAKARGSNASKRGRKAKESA